MTNLVSSSNPTLDVVEDVESVQSYKDRLKSNPAIVSGKIGVTGYIVLSAFMNNQSAKKHRDKTSVELIDIEIVKSKNYDDLEEKFGSSEMFDERTGVLKDEFLETFFNEFGEDFPTKMGFWFRRSVVCPLVGNGKIRIYDLNLDFSQGNVLQNVFLCCDGKMPYLDAKGIELTPQSNNWSFSQSEPKPLEAHQAIMLEKAKANIAYRKSLTPA